MPQKTPYYAYCRKVTAAPFTLLLCTVTALLLGCSSKQGGAIEDVDHTTPEATVIAWYQAISDGDVHLQQALADSDSDVMKTAIQGSERLKRAGIAYHVMDLEVRPISNDGHHAKLRVKYKFQTVSKKVMSEVQVGGALVSLVRKGDQWYIIRLGDDLDE